MKKKKKYAIKAVFVKSSVFIRIIPKTLLAAEEITKPPTWGTNQVWMSSQLGRRWSFIRVAIVVTVRSIRWV